MSVDKFGRTLRSLGTSVQGPKGEGFDLTSEGDYDIKSKRMRFVHDPVDELDAVNLQTLNRKCLTLAGDVYDAKNKPITSVAKPFLSNDVVTLQSLEGLVPRKLEDSYSIHNYRLQDVAYPKNDQDAVNYTCLRKEALVSTDGKIFDAKDRFITNVTLPVRAADVANKLYVDLKCPVQSDYYWGFNNKRLNGIKDPVHDGDAVNLRTLHREALLLGQGGFNANDKQIKHVGAPTDNTDAVNMVYVQTQCAENVKTMGTMIAKQQGELNVIKTRQAQLDGKLVDSNRYHENRLKKLATLLFKYIHQVQGKTVTLPPAPPDDYLNWEAIFDTSVGRSPH